MFSVDSMAVVADTGDELETMIAEQYPSIFNSDAENPDATPEERFDTRSDDRVRHCCLARRTSRKVYANLNSNALQNVYTLFGLFGAVRDVSDPHY